MASEDRSLIAVFEGWETYQQSLVDAITPLSSEHLMWRPAPHLRSAGDLAGHISLGRIDWFDRMGAPVGRAVASCRINPDRTFPPHPVYS